jgi:uncharacterized membrane protein
MWPMGFLLSYNKYSTARNDLFNAIFEMDNLHIVETRVLLWGDNSIGIKDVYQTIWKILIYCRIFNFILYHF